MKKILSIVLFMLLSLHFTSCGDVDIISPPGAAGLSAYNEWVKGVKAGVIVWEGDTDLGNFFKFLKGDKGPSGADAYQIWKDYVGTGTVDNPHKPGAKWNPARNSQVDFYAFLTGARGDAGLTPHINAKGNWQIGNTDTGIAVKGIAGQPGQSGQPGGQGPAGVDGSAVKIGLNGNWEIDGLDTGVLALAKDAATGKDGASAYEFWVKEVEAGNIRDKQGNYWPVGSISLGDFWNYLGSGSPLVIAPTTIKFIKSEVHPTDPSIEIFEFETEPQALVTMAYGSFKIVVVADDSGKCSISYPNEKSGNTPVFATALKAGKAESARLLLVVKAQPPYFKFAEEVIWLDENGSQLPVAQGEYRPDDEIPYLFLKNAASTGYRVELPIELKNVKQILAFPQEGNVNNYRIFYNIYEPNEAFFQLWREAYTAPDGNAETIVTFRVISMQDVIIHKQLRIKTTY